MGRAIALFVIWERGAIAFGIAGWKGAIALWDWAWERRSLFL